MVLVHGIGSSWQAFAPVLDALEACHEVLALDLPGFGGSAPLANGVRPTIAALADAVEEAIGAAGFERPHVVGNSLGGWIGLELARRGAARTMVAISPGGLPLPREKAFTVGSLMTTYSAARALAPRAEAITRTAVGRTLLFSQIIARPWRMTPEDAASTLRTLADSTAFPETLEHTVATDSARGLEQISCPVTIAWGSRDALLFPRQAERFVQAIPGAKHRPLPGLGHVPMIDDPDSVARVILHVTTAGDAPGAGNA